MGHHVVPRYQSTASREPVMRSQECHEARSVWRGCLLLVLTLSGVVATRKQYTIDYGDGFGEARVEIDEETHTASIQPSSAPSPTTLITFKKGLVVYVTEEECMVSTLHEKEHDYMQLLLNHDTLRAKQGTLYVRGVISPRRVRRFLGEELFRWCDGKPTLRLSRRKPNFRSGLFSLMEDDYVHGGETLPLEEGRVISSDGKGTEHQRYKRKAKKEDKRSKERKGKSSKGRKGKGKKSKGKKGKKPKTKSLRNRAKKLNIIAPRIAFPATAVLQHNLTGDPTDAEAVDDHVVFQEEPYLSPSFTRTDDDGQRFKHYRGFYQEPNNDTYLPGHTNRIISHDTRSPIDGQSKISIPETIVKDGQIFYRYDAEETIADEKGQSKRSHMGDDSFLDDGAKLGDGVDHYNDSGDPMVHGFVDSMDHAFVDSLDRGFIESTDHPYVDSLDHGFVDSLDHGFVAGLDELSGSEGIRQSHLDQTLLNGHGLPHIQIQAQIGDGMRGASAGAISSTGQGVQAQGSSNPGGFFTAQAQSIGHRGGETSLTHVFGGQHGVQGSAATSGHGHQSHVQVEMGENPSSTAYVATHRGSALLSSSVHATQTGGRAGAHAYGNGTSKSNAQMEFNPSHPYSAGSELRGQGFASASVTNEGGSLLTSLSGEVSRGSYLGTAHSSIHNDLGLSSTIDDTAHSFQDDSSHRSLGLTRESHLEDIHRRQVFDQTHYGLKVFTNASSELGQDDSLHIDHMIDHSISGHSPEGEMVGNIMETVHQPNMHPEIIAYPVSELSIIDDGGMTVGVGVPPRESEIEQAPLSSSEDIQEGIGILPGDSKPGIAGLATYSHGRLGAPPGPGELLNYPLQPDPSQYDYGLYDRRYNSEYYDEIYEDLPPEDPNNLPFFDLGPEIVPIESNFESLRPMQLGLPDQPAVEPSSPEWTDHTDSLSPHQPIYNEGKESQQPSPDPPIIVHQVQAPTLLPEETWSGGSLTSYFQPSQFSKENETLSYEDELGPHLHAPLPHAYGRDLPSSDPTHSPQIYEDLDFYDRTPAPQAYEGNGVSFYNYSDSSDSFYDQTPVPFYEHTPTPQVLTETPLTPHLPVQTPKARTPQYQRFSDTHLSVSYTDVSPENQTIFSSPHLQNETSQAAFSQDFSESQKDIQLGVHSSLPAQSSVASSDPVASSAPSQTSSGTMMMMMGIPLYPGNPGSVHTLPGNEGGPDLKVMSLLASDVRADRSFLHQRKGISLQPGEKIPGAPGYKVPTGFRGHVILDHSPPANAKSRGVVEGISTQVRVSPQDSSSGSAIYASLSGHSAMRAQPLSEPTSGTSWRRQDSTLPRKSWDGRRHDMTTPQKSWNMSPSATHGVQRTGDGDSCGYYSMKCNIVYGPHAQSKICRPILITVGCCC